MDKNKGLTTPAAIVIFGFLLSAGVFLGLRYSNRGQQQTLPAKEETTLQPTANQAEVQVSIDDNPVLGDRETAKIAIVEFSDYECPYCARFKDETFNQIKENYIDSGQVILVFRDFPLSFHDPAATREANAAACVREQGGDQAFWRYHDLIFANTAGNGQGLNEEELVDLAGDLEVNPGQLKTCIQNNENIGEIEQDISAAAEIGITGTPGFVIGSLDGQGNVVGVKITGARPYDDFKTVIEQFL